MQVDVVYHNDHFPPTLLANTAHNNNQYYLILLCLDAESLYMTKTIVYLEFVYSLVLAFYFDYSFFFGSPFHIIIIVL